MFDWLSGDKGLRALATRSRGKGHSTTALLRVESLEARNLLASTQLLIGTYNVDIADQNGANRNTTYFQTVLAAMGREDNYYSPQAPDILTVTETRSNSVTGSTNDTDWITQQLNAVYGAGIYSHGTRNGSGGGGTEGIIYNTRTIQLRAEIAFGSGLVRQVLRYQVRPLAVGDGSADFYIYVTHSKAGSTTTDRNDRNTEAQQIRANADALGTNVPILYTGDFNADASTEPAEQTLTRAGNGQAFDPINRSGTWYNNSSMVDIDTIGSTRLNGRLDLLWESGIVRNGTSGNGLKDMPSTYHPFGNGGNVPLNQPVTYSANSALRDLSNRTTVLTDLTHTSDHIPLLQEYKIGTAANPATQFNVIANANPAIAGAPFDVTVQALDANGNVVPGYRGTVTFTSGDPYGASLPANYTFTVNDAGVHTFAAGAALYTAGTDDVTATDISSGITGSAYVNVQAAPAVMFYVSAPASAASGAAFDVQIYAGDFYYNVDTNYLGTVTWTSTDGGPGVMLPADYAFQPSDGGQVTYPAGVTLITSGDQFITATDTSSGITGSADVFVTSTGPRPGRGNHRNGLWQAVALIPVGQTLAPGTSSVPIGSGGTTSSLGRVGVDRFFSAAGNDSGWASQVGRKLVAALGNILDPLGDLAPGPLLTDRGPDPLAVD